MTYNRTAAVAYAHEWAYRRNPAFIDFSPLGGDCTNFVSQCLYAGSGVMNYTPDAGWYYISSNNRAAAWAGVEYLHIFLVSNLGAGPYASEMPLNYTQSGDIIQLSFDGLSYAHTLFVVSTGASPDASNILIAAHSNDSNCRPLDTYNYQKHRLLKIEGVRHDNHIARHEAI